MLNYFLQSIPLVIALVAWGIRLEIKLAQIQTDLTWLKKEKP